MIKKNLIYFVLILFSKILTSQTIVADEVIAVVGDYPVLASQVNTEYEQMKENFSGMKRDSALCFVLNKVLMEKLMLYKSQIDSITVGDDRVEQELDQRIRYFISRFGTEKNMEEYLGKSVMQIKQEYREKIKQQLKIKQIQQTLLSDVKVSPTEIKNYFNSLPIDSLPKYSAEAEIAIITRKPKVTFDERQYAYQKIVEIREKIVSGEKDFITMAALYSQDPGSGAKGGELGYFGRNEMVPEFEAAAFKLKPDSVSKIIETKFGFHIMKLLDRKGERINVRHILIKPTTISTDLTKAKKFLDSLRNLVMNDSLKFEELAKKYSDDEDTKPNGGFLTDPLTGAKSVAVEELDKDMYFTIENMKPGDISDARQFEMPDKTTAYRIIYLKNFKPPHVANLHDDYQKIQQAATEHKKQETLDKWMKRYKQKAYVRINKEWQNCHEIKKWVE